MGRLHNQIDDVKREIAKVDDDLDALTADFGLLVSSLRNPIVDGACSLLYQELIKAVAQRDALQSRIAHLTGLGEQLNGASARIAQLKMLMQRTQTQLETTFGRIGVIAWEESASNVLAEAIVSLLPESSAHQTNVAKLKARQTLLEEKSQRKHGLRAVPSHIEQLFVSRRLHRLNDETQKLFIESGKAIAQAMKIRSLHSSFAQQLEQEYLSLNSELAGWEEELLNATTKISKSKDALNQAGVAGPVERKIQELKDSLRIAQERLAWCASAYGREIHRLTDPWENREASVEVLQCENQINRHERRRRQLESKIKSLETEIEIDEQVVLISQDEERIAHIKETIDQFNRQISEIEAGIREKRDRIAKLKRMLNEISSSDTGREG